MISSNNLTLPLISHRQCLSYILVEDRLKLLFRTDINKRCKSLWNNVQYHFCRMDTYSYENCYQLIACSFLFPTTSNKSLLFIDEKNGT